MGAEEYYEDEETRVAAQSCYESNLMWSSFFIWAPACEAFFPPNNLFYANDDTPPNYLLGLLFF